LSLVDRSALSAHRLQQRRQLLWDPESFVFGFYRFNVPTGDSGVMIFKTANLEFL